MRGKWRFRLGFPCKNLFHVILVVTGNLVGGGWIQHIPSVFWASLRLVGVVVGKVFLKDCYATVMFYTCTIYPQFPSARSCNMKKALRLEKWWFKTPNYFELNRWISNAFLPHFFQEKLSLERASHRNPCQWKHTVDGKNPAPVDK